MSDTSSTAVALYQGPALAVLQKDNEALEDLRENIMLGGGLTEKDIRKVKNPSGGQLMFEIGRAAGEPEYVRELTGVALAVLPRRTLWANKNVDSGEFPVCSSTDMVNGAKRRGEDGGIDIPLNILEVGVPGGEAGKCAGCPFDEWGSGVDEAGKPTDGKRCTESRIIYFLRAGDILPVKMTVPSSSLGKFGLSVKALPAAISKSVVKVSLSKEETRGGKKVAMYNVEFAGKLDPASIEGLKAYRPLVDKLIENASAERTDEIEAERYSRGGRGGRAAKEREEIPEDQRFGDKK